jgi:hypothetical protein
MEGGYAAGGTCRELISSLEMMDGASIIDLDWRDFESHCGKILGENGYSVIGGIVFTNGERKYQVDILATSLRHALCIDCKAWKRGGGIGRSMKAAEEQLERTVQLRASLETRGLSSLGDSTLYPAIVTLMNEGISVHEGIPIVPFELFNSFLVSFDSYENELIGV